MARPRRPSERPQEAPKFSWSKGSRYKLDPQVAGEYLDAIKVRLGKQLLEASDVLEAAADPSSPIHGAFEWDDEKAAAEHRLDQARQLLAAVKFSYWDQKGEEKTIRYFVNYQTTTTSGYAVMPDVAKSPEWRQMTIDRLWRELDRLNEQLQQYQEFFAISELIAKGPSPAPASPVKPKKRKSSGRGEARP